MEFKKKTDDLKTAGLLGLAYGSFLPYLYMTQSASSISEYALRFALISTVCVAINTPSIQKKITGLFNRNSTDKEEKEPVPQNILDTIKEFRQKAGISKEINVEIYGNHKEKNAETDGQDLYIGKGLLNNLSPSEIKFAIAHEMSHIKTSDFNRRHLFQPTIRNAQFDYYSNIAAYLFTAAPGATILSALFLSSISYLFQDYVLSPLQRHQEYRADRNAVHLTKDFKSAATALVKISPTHLKKTSWAKNMFSSHPRGIERLQNLERESTADKTTECSDLVLKFINDNNIDPRTLSNPEAVIENAYKEIHKKQHSCENRNL